MESIVKNIIELNFEEIEDYDFPCDEFFGLKIKHNDVCYCFIIKFSSNNKNLICFGPGAQSREARSSSGKLLTPPYFHR